MSDWKRTDLKGGGHVMSRRREPMNDTTRHQIYVILPEPEHAMSFVSFTATIEFEDGLANLESAIDQFIELLRARGYGNEQIRLALLDLQAQLQSKLSELHQSEQAQ